MSSISNLLQIRFFASCLSSKIIVVKGGVAADVNCYYIMCTAMKILSWNIWPALVVPTIYLHAVYINSYAGFRLYLAPLDKNYYQCGLHKLHAVYSIWKPYFSRNQCLNMNPLLCFLMGRLSALSGCTTPVISEETSHLNIHTLLKKRLILSHTILTRRWLTSLKCRTPKISSSLSFFLT